MAKQITSEPKSKKTGKKHLPEQESQRRDFLKVSVASAIGLCAVAVPLCAAVCLISAPVFDAGPPTGFYPVADLDSLTDRPQMFTVLGVKNDAWTTLPKEKIGAVFLRKIGDSVQAFQSRCPHAGCTLQSGIRSNPKTGAAEELFYCPCLSAHFDLTGNRLDSASPRNMDSLEIKIESGRVFVKLKHFVFGISEKRER